MRTLLATLLFLPAFAFAQPAPERHSEVRIYAPASDTNAGVARQAIAERLASEGLLLDHARPEQTERGLALRTVLSATERAAAEASGLELDVIVEDLKAHYLANRSGVCEDGQDISRISASLCGTMGGYPTYDAIVGHLEAMHAQYPDLISAPTSIGESYEGRDIWMLEISDNPGVEEDEGEVLYTAVHHAREPGGMAAVLYFMYYLLENYGTHDEVTDIVDNVRLFFVPVLNPDGYLYNEKTDPEGGGFWRKNRRDNGGNVFGVDLNRNYEYAWGYNDLGSSPNPSSGTYRGTEPFSEPETQAIRDFLESGRRVTHAFNYHTFSELLLYPWGYELDYTDDHDELESLAESLTEYNGYTYGTGPEILYAANGNSDDWMYGEQGTKGKIFSYTPEVGYSFWPDPADVYRLADDNLEANLRLAQAAMLPPVTNEPGAVATEGIMLYAAYPNPARHQARVTFELRDAGSVRVALHDVLGREVAVLFAGSAPSGPTEIAVRAADYPSGLYVIRLEAASQVLSRPVTILR